MPIDWEKPGPASLALGQSLRQWRVVRRYKQSRVAELLQVSQATVSRWENGRLVPTDREGRAIEALIAARLETAADRQLSRLVQTSALPLHLICDFTHRLLACSPVRARQFRVDVHSVVGTSLWPCATEGIVAAETRLETAGWYERAGMVVEGETEARTGPVIDIAPARFRWTRLLLSDGSFVRLVETVGA